MDFMVGLIKKDFGAFNFIHIRERANKSQFFTLMSFLSKNKRRAGVHDETLLLLVLPDDELLFTTDGSKINEGDTGIIKLSTNLDYIILFREEILT